jgi:tight adherence protein B
MAVLLSILTFLVVLGLFAIIWLFFETDKNQERVRQRMEAVHKAERRGNIDLGVKLVRDELLSSIPVVHQVMMRWSWSMRFKEFVVQAGIETRPAKIVLISAVLGFGSFLITELYLRHNFLISMGVGIVLAIVPFAYVAWKRKRRLGQFEEHFPEALDLLGRAVRAGHAFTTGLEMITKECDEPIAGEFRTVFEEQNFGLPLRDAMLNLTERVPLIDARFFVTALLIQKETGGNLAEILDGLARVIRDRFRIHREVKTRTAQGRITAGILLAIPPFMMFMLGAVNPQYMKPLYEDPIGPMIVGIAAVLQFVGAVLLWKIINIEV